MPRREKKNVISGRVSGEDVEILLDSGADYGMVPKSLVPVGAYCGKKCYVTGIHKDPVLYEMADVWFELPGIRLKKRVVVDESNTPSPWCLMPVDLGDTGEIQVFLNVLHKGKVCVMTRAQCREEELLDDDNNSVVVSPKEAPSGVNSISGSADKQSCDDVIIVDSVGEGDSEAQMPSRVMAEALTDEGGSASSDSSVLEEESVEENCLDPSVEGQEGTVGADMPAVRKEEAGAGLSATASEDRVPGVEGKELLGESAEVKKFIDELLPVNEGSEREEFKREVANEEGLKPWRELGERKERGFSYKKGILVQSKYIAWEEFREVLIAPKSYRVKILRIAHDKGGHLRRH